ncbi:MAG: DNA primase small subunit domain-containing protein [Candidatus Odinarchaeota archaeon]
MPDHKYLKRIFQAYYKENRSEIQIPSLFENREFGFIPWEKQVMNRHIGFTSSVNLKNYFINNTPKHAYSSGSLFLNPENQDMQEKGYQGCDLIFDIDVDHFYTPCKEHHDIWYCKECGEKGKGMVERCPKCGKLKLKKLNWICEDCLNIAKNEIIKLIYNFLIPDFDISIDKMKIAFSGHRGYHLKVEDENIRTLSSDERREIIDYITGENISIEILGLQEKGGNIFGFSKNSIGWPQKIVKTLISLLSKSNIEIENILSDKRKFNLSQGLIENFINFKDNFYKIINNDRNNNWTLVGFSMNAWNKFLKAMITEIGVQVDIPVSIDVHRLIRYPGSLHGSTGFRVQELYPDDLDNFNPLNEWNEKLDPIVFKSEKKIIQKIEITELELPITKMKGETYGPYTQGEKIEVPHYFAVFLLCKGVAKII